MLNLIVSGSQYIYQNLIKKHLVSSSHLKGTRCARSPSEFPAQRFLAGQRAAPGPAPSAGLCPSRAEPSPQPRPERSCTAREHARLLLRKKESLFGFGQLKTKHSGGFEAPSSRNRSHSSQLIWAPCNIFGFSPPLNIHAIGNIYMK